MSKFRLTLIFFINLIINITLISRVSILGNYFNINIPLIIILSMTQKDKSIPYYALFLGLFLDILFSNIVGIQALSYYLIAYFISNNHKYKGLNYTYGLSFVGLFSFLNRIFVSGLELTLDNSINFVDFVSLFKGGIYIEIFLSMIIYSLIYLVFKYKDDKRKKEYYF